MTGLAVLGGETVVILRPGPATIDRYGNQVAGPDVRFDVEHCAVAPRQSGDVTNGGRSGVIVGTEVFFPPATDVTATDRLEVRGETHDIVGDVIAWIDPYSGAPKGTVVSTQRVEG